MSVEAVTLEKIQEDIQILQLALDGLRAQVYELVSKQASAVKEGRPLKFTDLEGIWAGMNLSYEEIKAAEYQVPEDLL